MSGPPRRKPGQQLQSRGHARRLAGVLPGEVRRGCGISQGTIAEAIGVTRAAVSAWETGRSRPSGEAGEAYCRVVAALARHLEVTW